MKRGSIDFDFPETKIILDAQGRPVEIKPYERNVATKIIEDFMLLANETVAQDYFGRNCRLCTVPTRTRIRRRSTSWQRLSIILAIRFISGRMKYTRRELQKLLLRLTGRRRRR